MKLNMSNTDRIARAVLGVVLIALALSMADTIWGWIGWLGVIPLATSLIGWCPIYKIFGWSTKQR